MDVGSIHPIGKAEALHDSSPQVAATCQSAASCNDQSLDSWQSAFQPYISCSNEFRKFPGWHVVYYSYYLVFSLDGLAWQS